MANHLWWNGYDHSHGETAEEALANYMAVCGMSAEDCEGDGWEMVPDDEAICDEDNCDAKGKPQPTGQTARQWADQLAAAPRASGKGDGDEWQCPCGYLNVGSVCTKCGRAPRSEGGGHG